MVRCWECCSDASTGSIFAVFFRAAEVGAFHKPRSSKINKLVFAHFSFSVIKPSFGFFHIFSHINHSATPQSNESRKNFLDTYKESLKTRFFFIKNSFIPLIFELCSLGIFHSYNIECGSLKNLPCRLIVLSSVSFHRAKQLRQTLVF